MEENKVGMDTSEVIEIVGQEETEEAEIAGMEEPEEAEIGFSFKKFRKKLGKAIRPLKKVAKVIAPVPVFATLAAARVSKPIARKVGLIRRAAQTPPQVLAQQMRDEYGQPAPIEKAIETQAMAQQAWENLQAAAEVQEQAFEDTGDYSAYDPYAEPWMEEESVEGEPSLYEWGAMAGANDLLGFSFKKFVRKVGRAVDPTKAGSPFRSALQAIPGVGPQLTAAADMLAKARAGDKASKQKIEDVKALSDAGDPRGKEALANLQAANVLAPKTKLLKIFSRYEYGARVSV